MTEIFIGRKKNEHISGLICNMWLSFVTQNLKTLAPIGAEKSVTENFIGKKIK